MYASLRRFQAAKSVPVVAIFEDVAASGGYYVACAADEMIAHPTSVTGSIGVIIQTVSFAGTMKMIGIDARAITSGQYKDMGSPLKPLDQQHHELFQKMVNEFYERFVGVVDQGRPDLSTERVRELADGRVYTAIQARQAGLVDRIGYMEDAVARAKELSGVGKAKLVMYHRPFGHRANVYSQTSAPSATEINLLKLDASSIPTQPHPRFLYLWTGRE
jgi:protease-4